MARDEEQMELPGESTTPAQRLRLVREAAAQERAAGLQELQRLVTSREIRDWPFDDEFYAELFRFGTTALSWGAEQRSSTECAEKIFLCMLQLPEFDVATAGPHVTDEFVWALATKTDGRALQEEWPFLRDAMLWVYENFVARRAELRCLVGRTLRAFCKFSHRAVPVGPLLQVLTPIIRGFKAPLSQVHQRLLLEILLPLHRTNDWLQWDRQTPLLSMYHKELVQCIKLYLERQPSLSVRCVEVLCTHFPQARESNTPKEVLLLYEIAALLKFVDTGGFQQLVPALVRQMVRLLGSHNSQPIQAVLQFWKDDHVAKLFGGAAQRTIPALLPVLLRGGEPFWNPTVNRMTSLVLEKLERSSPEVFAQAAEDVWGPGCPVPAFQAVRAEASAQALDGDKEAPAALEKPQLPPNPASLKFRMGGWKPPSGRDAGSAGAAQPPSTITGVAPWAFDAGTQRAGPLAAAQAKSGGTGPKQPPLTVTGVAPWAFQGQPRGGPASGSAGQGHNPPLASTALPAFKEEEEEREEDKASSGIERVHAYLKVLCPATSSADGSVAPWEAALSAESPTLLPTLKFHQLVFGHQDIGKGAFSVVRYARTIDKEKTQSQWAEYAVKVIDTKTMQDLGYEASVSREISVLRMLSHPGIARMVSSFRWRDGAYLVLEYANRGDLHNILVRMGKLEESMVQFFMGEVIAALTAIHEIGFVYGDLKPENIVVTATCHAKLTDFGGCRPITQEGRERTRQSLLRTLRDGDWRAPDAPVPDGQADQQEAPLVEDDGRVEGTTMYLPPEVVRGGPPTLAADAWALGCLVFQLLSGRPPLWVESEQEEELRLRIVAFNLNDGAEGLHELSGLARDLASRLLQQDATERLSVAGAADDPFFEGLDVFTLYRRPRGPELPSFEKAPAPKEDERWQKRQFSKIWTVAPSPQEYSVPTCGGQMTCTAILETDAECAAPFSEDSWTQGPSSNPSEGASRSL